MRMSLRSGAAVFLLSVLSSGCMMTTGSDAPGSGGSQNQTGGGGDGGGGGGGNVNGGQAVAGVKAMPEMMTILASATGVDPYKDAGNDEIYDFYLNVRMLLPLRGGSDEGTAMSTIAMLSLCSFFSRQMVANENADAGGGRFGAELKMSPQALTSVLRNKLIQKTFNLILRRDATTDELMAARTEFDLIAPNTSSNQVLTQRAVRVVVTALLQSPSFQVQ